VVVNGAGIDTDGRTDGPRVLVRDELIAAALREWRERRAFFERGLSGFEGPSVRPLTPNTKRAPR
jgi:hypothetical protein